MLCNISIVGTEQIEVESGSMCNYVNYHVVMFVVCGVCSLIMMLMVCVCPVCCGPEVETGGCVIWASVFFFLMAGFEGSIVILIALEYLVMLFVIIFNLLEYCRRRPAKVRPIAAAAVVEEVVNVVGIPLSPGTQAAQAAVEIVPASVVVVENSSSCCGI
jgi:hypothetical protein